MSKIKKYFGCEEEKIREIFRNSEDQVDANSKIEKESTLFQLSESSGRMIEENSSFLQMVYNELDK